MRLNAASHVCLYMRASGRHVIVHERDRKNEEEEEEEEEIALGVEGVGVVSGVVGGGWVAHSPCVV